MSRLLRWRFRLAFQILGLYFRPEVASTLFPGDRAIQRALLAEQECQRTIAKRLISDSLLSPFKIDSDSNLSARRRRGPNCITPALTERTEKVEVVKVVVGYNGRQRPSGNWPTEKRRTLRFNALLSLNPAMPVRVLQLVG